MKRDKELKLKSEELQQKSEELQQKDDQLQQKDDQLKNVVKLLYSNGMNTEQIAMTTGFSKDEVEAILNKAE